MSLFFEGLLAVLSGTAGLLIGFQLSRSNEKPTTSASEDAEEPSEPSNSADAEQVRHLLSNLHQISTGVVGDVREHTSTIEAIGREFQGSRDGTRPSTDVDVLRVIAEIVKANDKLQVQLVEATETIEEQAREIQCQLEEAMTDALTEIPNRRAFDFELERRLAECRRAGTDVSLLILDIDHFKQFNDRYGHQTGDDVLRVVAGTLRQAMREMDLPARYGGEEFAAVLPQTGLEDAKRAAERVRTAIETAKFDCEHGELKVTVSVGISQARGADQPGTLIERADGALYAAKRGGRNRSYFHDDGKSVPVVDEASCPDSEASADAQPPAESVQETPEAATEAGEVAPENISADRTDRLTGLPNRQAFHETLTRRLAERQRHGTSVSVVLVEVDGFKFLKDLYGSKGGHLILQQVPRFLAAALRETDLVARYGDGTFSVMLPVCEIEGAALAADRVRAAIARCHKLRIDGKAIRFTLSVGVAEATDCDEVKSLIGRATKAVRSAESQGGNVTCVCRVAEKEGVDFDPVANFTDLEDAEPEAPAVGFHGS